MRKQKIEFNWIFFIFQNESRIEKTNNEAKPSTSIDFKTYNFNYKKEAPVKPAKPSIFDTVNYDFKENIKANSIKSEDSSSTSVTPEPTNFPPSPPTSRCAPPESPPPSICAPPASPPPSVCAPQYFDFDGDGASGKKYHLYFLLAINFIIKVQSSLLSRIIVR